MEDRFISNMTFRVVLLGIQEIIGENGLNTVLNYAGIKKYRDNFPQNNKEKNTYRASEVTLVDKGVIDIFGNNGASAVLAQVGKMQAKWGLEENPETVAAAKKIFENMSDFETAKTALEMTAAVLSAESDCKAWVTSEGEDLLYHIDEATHCFNIKKDAPICFVTSGFVSAIIAWATGDNLWQAKEETCMAMGAPHCTHRLRKMKG